MDVAKHLYLLPDFLINISAAYFIMATVSITQMNASFFFAVNIFSAILYYQLAVYFKTLYE